MSLKNMIYNLLSQHFHHNACIAIMGNIHVQTGGTYDYTIHQEKGGNGYGLFQFDFHKKYYFNYLSQNSLQDSAKSQISYVVSTIYGQNKNIIGVGHAEKIGKIMRDQSLSIRELTIYFCNLWEKPGIPHLDRRIAASEQIFG